MRTGPLLASLTILTSLSGFNTAAAAEPIKVVASFSILGDLVQQVAGDRAEVLTLVGPDADAHVYEPTPSDAKEVASADLVVVNGIGFEGWLERMIEASAYAGPVVTAAEGVQPRSMAAEHEDETHGAGHAHEDEDHDAHGHDAHDHDEGDPHAWQSVQNAIIYVGNIADGLCQAAPTDCGTFRDNAATYTAELGSLDAQIRASFAEIPADKRKVITTHDAFGYFGEAYGIAFLAPQGVSTEAEASATDVAALIQQIRDEGARALFVESISNPRLLEQIARETGVTIGGAIYSDALSGPEGPAATYLNMMRHNAELIAGALRQS